MHSWGQQLATKRSRVMTWGKDEASIDEAIEEFLVKYLRSGRNALSVCGAIMR